MGHIIINHKKTDLKQDLLKIDYPTVTNLPGKLKVWKFRLKELKKLTLIN